MFLYKFINICIVTIIVFSSIAGYGWASPTLPILLSENSPIPITNNEGSWIVVMFFPGIMVGAVTAIYAMDRYARILVFYYHKSN